MKRGFAPFSIFVGVIMLGIAIAIASSVQSQANTITYQIQQREAMIQGVFNASVFSMDAVTTFEQALQHALQSEGFTYSVNLTAAEKDIIKSTVKDFIKAFTSTKIYTAGTLIAVTPSGNINEAVSKATKVKAVPSKNLILVQIRPRPGAIPMAEMNIYTRADEVIRGGKGTPQRSFSYPLFPVDVNTDIYAYVPVKGIQDTISKVQQDLGSMSVLLGFVGKTGFPEAALYGVYGGTTKELGVFSSARTVTDKNYPLRALLSQQKLDYDPNTYYKGLLLEQASQLIKQYLEKKDGITDISITNVKIADQKKKYMPFRKFICVTGAFAKALVADPDKTYTVCINVTDIPALKKVISSDLLRDRGYGYLELPYTYIKSVTVTFKKDLSDKCIGTMKTTMTATATLQTGYPGAVETPSTMELDATKEVEIGYPAGDIVANSSAKDDLEWGFDCPKFELSNIGPARCTYGCTYSCIINGKSTTCDGGSECTGILQKTCNDKDAKRQKCWNELNNDFTTCQNWIRDVLGYYVGDPSGAQLCGSSANNPPKGYENRTDICKYCTTVATCESSCPLKWEYITNNPYEWWDYVAYKSNKQFIDFSTYSFKYNARTARDAVKEWINYHFFDQCQKVLDADICQDLQQKLSNYTSSTDVYVLSSTTDVQNIANQLVEYGGGILSITVINTDKWNSATDTAKWKAVSAGVVYCNKSYGVGCKVVAKWTA